jgi:hypothetical protein
VKFEKASEPDKHPDNRAQVCDRFAARFFDFSAMPVIPELGGDPEILAAQAGIEQRRQNLADRPFIAIDRSAIEMAVSCCDGTFDRFSDPLRRDVIRPEGPKSNGGDPRSGVERLPGHERRIDAIPGDKGALRVSRHESEDSIQ